MNTFIINLNDTTALSDSVVAKIIKLSEASQPVVTEAGTNWADFAIVGIICLAIVAVALIAKCAVLSWKKAEIAFKEKERNDKEAKEEKDETRKQKANLLNKLLDFQKELAFPYDKNKNGEYMKKEYESKEKENYQKTLASLLGIILSEYKYEKKEP